MTEVIRALGYRVVWAHDVDYERAPRVQVETNDFDLDLFGRELRATLKREYSTIEQARTQVEDYLRGWEIVIGIAEHPDAVHFEYERAEVDEVEIDPETGHHMRQEKALIEASANLLAVLHVSRGKYPQPEPADSFHVNSVVEALYARYSLYQNGRELLLSMANFCLSVLLESSDKEKREQKRTAAARKYSIDKEVLSKLGDICANKGAEYEARKAPSSLSFTPLSHAEKKWVLGVVKTMMLRAGRLAAMPDKQYPEIKMLDFPDL